MKANFEKMSKPVRFNTEMQVERKRNKKALKMARKQARHNKQLEI